CQWHRLTTFSQIYLHSLPHVDATEALDVPKDVSPLFCPLTQKEHMKRPSERRAPQWHPNMCSFCFNGEFDFSFVIIVKQCLICPTVKIRIKTFSKSMNFLRNK